MFSTSNPDPKNFEELNGGVDYFLLNFFTQNLNFTYDIIDTHHNFFSLINGTVGGIIGLVNSSKVDFGIVFLGVDEARREFVDFSYPYESDSVSYMISENFAYKGHVMSSSLVVLTQILLILLVLFLLSTIISVLIKIAPGLHKAFDSL